MATSTRRRVRPATPISIGEAMWGGPSGEGLVWAVKSNTSAIADLTAVQKSTLATVSELVNTQAEMQREHREYRDQAKLDRAADLARINSLEQARGRILTALAIVGVATILPASVLTILAHVASLGIHF